MGTSLWIVIVFILIIAIILACVYSRLIRTKYMIFQDTYGFWLKKKETYQILNLINYTITDTIQESDGFYIAVDGHRREKLKIRYFKTQEEVDAWVTKDKNESILVKEFTYIDKT